MENQNAAEEEQGKQKSISGLLALLVQMTVIGSSILTCWLLPNKLYLFIFLSILILGTILYFKKTKYTIIGLILAMLIWGWFIYNNSQMAKPSSPPAVAQVDKDPAPVEEKPVAKPAPVGSGEEFTTTPTQKGDDQQIKMLIQADLNNLATQKNQEEIVKKIQTYFSDRAVVEIHFADMDIPIKQELERYLSDLNTQKTNEKIKILNELLSSNPVLNHQLIVLHHEKAND